jgi:hypothetical protein
MIYKIILIIILVVLLVYLWSINNKLKENFSDPYSCVMFKDIVNKHQRWNDVHQKRMYWNFMSYPQLYKE